MNASEFHTDHRPPPLRISLRQMLLLVAYAAIASACITPAFRLWELEIQGVEFLILLEIPVVSLAWAATSMLLLRRGRPRTLAILVFLQIALATGLGILGHTIFWLTSSLRNGGSFRLDHAIALALSVAVFLLLLLLFSLLAHHLLRTLRPPPPLLPSKPSPI